MNGETISETGRRTARIVVSGDHWLMRAAVRRLVECEEGLTVVRECDNRPESLAEAQRESPDLILLDIDLSTRCNGVLERVGALLSAAGTIPVLILTAADECNVVQFALEHGAIGFVTKDRSPEVLHRAIRAGLAGEAWLERSTMATVFRAAAEGEDDSAVRQFTAREREIIALVTLGLHNKAIAERLCISHTTVRHHLTSIFLKFDVANRLELMRLMFAGDASLQPLLALASR